MIVGSKSRPVLIAAAILLATAFILVYIWVSLGRSDYFRIKYIITKNNYPVDLSYLKGKNILALDLEAESRYIAGFYPDYKRIKLARVLPDRIYVICLARRAAALVKLYKYFAVDDEGLLFDAGVLPAETNLPVVTGLETKIFGPKPGKRYNVRELYLALQVIKEARKTKFLRNYRMIRVNAPSPAGLSAFIAVPAQGGSGWGVFEVKLGGARIRDKIALLDNIVSQEREGLSGVKYIDLRFSSPVIKFNDPKR